MQARKTLPIVMSALTAIAVPAWARAEAGPPLVWKAECSSLNSKPGHAVRVTVLSTGNTTESYAIEGLNQTAVLQPLAEVAGGWEGFLAVPVTARGGYHSLTIAALANDGSRECRVADFEVVAKVWKPAEAKPAPEAAAAKPQPRRKVRGRAKPRGYVAINIKNFKTYDYSGESQEVARARETGAGFSGVRIEDFDWPLLGRITGQFGKRRVYNGGLASWYHRGVDIGAATGTKIVCPAEGVVVMTRNFKANGNTTVIDHGFGVTTTYLHQHAILVREGERVSRNQVIGEVGSTGASLGPHLHFQINVNGVPVTPLDFLNDRSKTGRLRPKTAAGNET